MIDLDKLDNVRQDLVYAAWIVQNRSDLIALTFSEDDFDELQCLTHRLFDLLEDLDSMPHPSDNDPT